MMTDASQSRPCYGQYTEEEGSRINGDETENDDDRVDFDDTKRSSRPTSNLSPRRRIFARMKGDVMATSARSIPKEEPLGRKGSRRKFQRSPSLCTATTAATATATTSLYIGRLLGEGAFCHVRELSATLPCFPFRSPRASTKKVEVSSDKLDLNAPLVLKFIKQMDSDTSSQLLEEAVGDLRREASMLSTLRHPNIITFFGSFNDDEMTGRWISNQFLVLEQLDETLAQRILRWRKQFQSSPNRGCNHKVFADLKQLNNQDQADLFIRLSIARDVANAMKYLHEGNIIHRDLKPENIGFNMQGIVKIFDFGMSRQLPITTSSSSQNNDTYEMSGNIGTLRYMAPEVALRKPYNSSVDVYSFAILLWEVWTLQKAFEDSHFLQNFVWLISEKGLRPELQRMDEYDLPLMPPNIIDLMQRGWSNQIQERPKFDEIHNVLGELLLA